MLTLSRKELKKALMTLRRVAGVRQTMPILGCIRFDLAPDGSVVASATDLERAAFWRFVGVELSVPFGVDLKRLGEIVGKSRSDEVSFDPSEDGTTLKISSGAVSFELPAISVEEFPDLPKVSFFESRSREYPVANVAEACRQVVYASSRDETRYNLNAIYMEPVESSRDYRWVATDGHRLALSGISAPGWPVPEGAVGLLIPRVFFEDLARLVGVRKSLTPVVQVWIDATADGKCAKGYVAARVGPATLVVRLIEGEFPNYRQVIPEQKGHIVTTNREALLQGVESVERAAPERSHAIQLAFDTKGARVWTENPDMGKAETHVPARATVEAISGCEKGENNPKGIAFAVNGRYLAETLKSFSEEEVYLYYEDHLTPILIEGADPLSEQLAVVMPMRV